MTQEKTWDQLNDERRALEQQREDLMRQQTPVQEVTLINNAVEQVEEVLNATSEDLSGVKEKIGEYTDKLKAANSQLEAALNDPRVRELTEGISAGLDEASGTMSDAAGSIGSISDALDQLQEALELADSDPTAQLEALASTLEAAAERLGPLIERIPGLGAFFEIYVKAVRNIAISVGQIRAVQERLQRIWVIARPGTTMYLVPRTAQERQADDIRALDEQIAAVAAQMIEIAQAERDAIPDAVPTEVDQAVRNAESACAGQKPKDNNPNLLAYRDAAIKLRAADEQLNRAEGNYVLACEEAAEAEVALATPTTGRETERRHQTFEMTQGARNRAKDDLDTARAARDAAFAEYRSAQDAYLAEVQAHRDCVKAALIDVIPMTNRGRGFTTTDFQELKREYPQYYVGPAEVGAAASTEEAEEETSSKPVVAPVPAAAQTGGLWNTIKRHPAASAVVAAVGAAIPLIFLGIASTGGGGDVGQGVGQNGSAAGRESPAPGVVASATPPPPSQATNTQVAVSAPTSTPTDTPAPTAPPATEPVPSPEGDDSAVPESVPAALVPPDSTVSFVGSSASSQLVRFASTATIAELTAFYDDALGDPQEIDGALVWFADTPTGVTTFSLTGTDGTAQIDVVIPNE